MLRRYYKVENVSRKTLSLNAFETLVLFNAYNRLYSVDDNTTDYKSFLKFCDDKNFTYLSPLKVPSSLLFLFTIIDWLLQRNFEILEQLCTIFVRIISTLYSPGIKEYVLYTDCGYPSAPTCTYELEKSFEAIVSTNMRSTASASAPKDTIDIVTSDLPTIQNIMDQIHSAVIAFLPPCTEKCTYNQSDYCHEHDKYVPKAIRLQPTTPTTSTVTFEGSPVQHTDADSVSIECQTKTVSMVDKFAQVGRKHTPRRTRGNTGRRTWTTREQCVINNYRKSRQVYWLFRELPFFMDTSSRNKRRRVRKNHQYPPNPPPNSVIEMPDHRRGMPRHIAEHIRQQDLEYERVYNRVPLSVPAHLYEGVIHILDTTGLPFEAVFPDGIGMDLPRV